MGVLNGWRFCPRCSASLNRDGSSLACPECGLAVYPNPAVASSALVERDGRLLLARRARDPEGGKWDLVGGFIDEGEEPRDGVIREVREETGLDAEVGGLFGVWTDWYGESDDAVWVVDVVYRASAPSGEPEAADDVAELRWFAPDELPPREEFAFTHPALVVDLWRQQHA